jgi:hypothetical protein
VDVVVLDRVMRQAKVEAVLAEAKGAPEQAIDVAPAQVGQAVVRARARLVLVLVIRARAPSVST